MLDGPRKATPFYYQLDQLGTPQELTDYSGEIMWSAKYRAYGNLAALDVSEIDNPLRFQGQYFDTESGLHYNRHRYYNPGTGRFLTPDPIKLVGGLNGYQYVPNPTGWVDPLGLNCTPGQCPDAEPPKWTENSVFNKYPKKTVIKTSGPEEQAAFLQEHLPGLPKEQAQMILEQSYKKGTSVVIGGSRVRGDSHPGSDLDVGFGDVNANKAGKILKDLKKSFEGKEGFLSLEETKIAPGNKTASIEEIKSPEEFFQRSGKRSEQDQKAGEAYRPSGSITLKEDGTITLIPPGELP